jgi:hypothetical protein
MSKGRRTGSGPEAADHPLRQGIGRRKVLIESEPPERESAERLLELESAEEIGTETV